MPLQQLVKQALGSPRVAPALHQDVQHPGSAKPGGGLVDRAPQPVLHAGDRQHDLVQVPLVTGLGSLRRSWLANACPDFSAHWRVVSWLTTMPRAASSSSTIRKLSGRRKRSQTAWLMTSAGKRWPT
jgi:hypothetical protein